ncbi:MAG: hypothetical protein WBM83_06830 [Flavobacteriaceae bacterium]
MSREYEAYIFNDTTAVKEITNSWAEDIRALNTHEEGAKAMKLDEVYSACEKEILTVNADDNYVYFEAMNDGLISLCSYFQKNCQDDCSVGFSITTFNWLE